MDKAHEIYMQRCLQLAELGAGHVAPNPMVGAVLVYSDRIIGEGYHQQYGEAHAEVNCIESVKAEDKSLIQQSTLYVSLEPCAHYGKTPPCADLIIQKKIPKVVIGCRDPSNEVAGRGIEKLQQAGIQLVTGISENACKILNKRFFTFHTKQRPYIILKWAQTADNKIAYNNGKRLLISNEFSNRIVHKWRAAEAAILIGTHTAEKDDPQLTNRLWTGKNPIRLIVDLNLRLNSGLNIFNEEAPTVIFNLNKNTVEFSDNLANKVYYDQVTKDENLVHQIANACHQLKIQNILVEGGAQLLQSFIEAGMWDEARVITNQNLFIGKGLAAPALKNAKPINSESVLDDKIEYFSYNELALCY